VANHSKPLILAVCLLILALNDIVQADGDFTVTVPVPAEYVTGFESITESDSQQILRHLVEGEMAGRGTGQEGFLKAAKWFSEQLEASGFQPAGENGSWFQNVPFIKLLVHADASHVKVGDAEELVRSRATLKVLFPSLSRNWRMLGLKSQSMNTQDVCSSFRPTADSMRKIHLC
jgi:hypothetical protein